MRILAALGGLLALVASAGAAPRAAGWPEPMDIGFSRVEGPHPDGAFAVELALRARQALAAVELAVVPTPGVRLDGPAPAFTGDWAAGEGLQLRITGRLDPALPGAPTEAPLPPGLSLALAFRYDTGELVRSLARAAADRVGYEALRAARRELGREPREARRMRFLPLVPTGGRP